MEYSSDERTANASTALRNVKLRLAKVFELFDRPGVTEVKINCATSVFVTRNGLGEEVDAGPLLLNEQVLQQVLAELASAQGTDATASTEKAAVHARMPGYRFAGLLFPVSTRGTSMRIRKHSPRVLTLDHYVESGQLPKDIANYLRAAVQDGKNIIISGSTDAGKTTFLNALSREIPNGDGVVSIEDTRELTLICDDWVPWEYNGQQGVTPSMLVSLAMRYSPRRIILGEMKDGVAADFIEACNTGHEGCMATVHANSCEDALARVEILCLRAGLGWPLDAIRQQISRVVHVVVQLRKDAGVRAITQISEVCPDEAPPIGHSYATKTIFSLSR